MRARVAYGLILGCVFASLPGCGSFQREERAAWRGQAELACLKQGLIVPTSFTRPIKMKDGPGTCGLDHPFQVFALSGGAVNVQPSARLGCPMNAALNSWMRDVVQPAAMARFGVEVAELDNMASYGCRTRNNRPGGKLSEHSFGNGLDIGGFILTDGRTVSVLKDWRRGDPQAQAFLRDVHAGACGIFKTVLGPGADAFHENHLHLDLARHNARQSVYCRPRIAPRDPVEPLIAPPDIDEMPMSYAPDAGGWPIAQVPDALTTGSARRRGGVLDELKYVEHDD